MIKEAYCSYEVSKLLKEKGFDEPCFAYYEDDGNFRQSWSNHAIQNKTNPCFFGNAAPTHQMACAWLREKHLIHVYAEYKAFFQERPKKLYYHWIPFVKTLPHCPINKSGFPKDTISLDVYCNTYEDAVEAALKYSLENLL